MKRWIWVLVFVAACEKGGGVGKERGKCYGNGTCDQGLVCLSEICVRPPGADCTKVGEKLASYRLGNYAPREERDQVVGELTALCTKERLTQDEGKCILDATTRYEVAGCPRPLLEELKADKTGCGAVGENLVRLLVNEMARDASTRAAVDRIAPEVEAAISASCSEDLWPDATKKCVSTAQTTDQLDDCRKTFPPGLEDKIEERLEPALEKLMDAMMGGKSGGAAKPAEAATPPPALPPTPAIDAGPPVATPTTATSMLGACQGYIDAVETYLGCTAIPQKARDDAAAGLEAMKKGFQQQQNPTETELAAAKQACELAQAALVDSMKQYSCP